MNTQEAAGVQRLSGRVDSGPSELVQQELLRPQFEFELQHLLPYYLAIEGVLVLEYRRMGLLDAGQSARITAALAGVSRQDLAGDPAASMVDIAFAVEQHVLAAVAEPVPAWHVDRSRNDLQACAQLMHLRAELLDIVGVLLGLGRAVLRRADQYRDSPMPGHTHYQAAQIITPGFYLSAVAEQVVHSANRLLATYDTADACPLGAGAMAGQELAWDRDGMADLLGFASVQEHALTAVASRRPALEVTAELSLLGAALSRFVTDLLHWSSGDSGFLELPDELAGISSAMPQKKNYPILERIRGRTAHLGAFHVDVVLGQRNLPFTNLVEVSKEAGSHVTDALDAARSVLRLLTVVLENLTFRTDRMRAACDREFFGGFTLANSLTLQAGIGWRQAQVMAGRYVRAAVDRGLLPDQLEPELLAEITGISRLDAARLLRDAFDVDGALRNKRTTGSVHPDAVRRLLHRQQAQHDQLDSAVISRRQRLDSALDQLAGTPSVSGGRLAQDAGPI